MEEFLQLAKEIHVIAEKLKGAREGSEEKKETEEPSSSKKKKSEDNKGNLRKKAPLVQINVSSLEFGDIKRFSVILDTSPFEFQENFLDPLLFFEIINGTLVKAGDIRKEMMQRKAKGRAHVSWDPRPATITSASTHAWTRKEWPSASRNCVCDPSYSEEGRDHSQPSMCKAWAIGAAIANKLWTDEPIEGMTFEKNLID